MCAAMIFGWVRLIDPHDEYRIKLLTILRQEARAVSIRPLVSNAEQRAWVWEMKQNGWLTTRDRAGVRVMAITQEGRRVLKAFERIYRD